MRRTPVISSHIVSIGYENGTLEIEFHEQSLYQYFDVPEGIYQGLMRAGSHGEFFYQNVEGNFPYQKIPYAPLGNGTLPPPCPSVPPLEPIKKPEPLQGNAMALFNAIKNGKMDVTNILLKNNPSWINSQNQEGQTPFHFAVSVNNVEIVKYLIKKGANVNDKDHNDVSPLWHAIERGLTDVATCLIEFGADVNAKDVDGMTPLHYAATKNSDVTVMQCLIDYGANVNAVASDENGLRPLHYAAWKNPEVAVLQFLIAHRADVNAKDDFDRTPLHYAAKYNSNIAIMQFLADHGADIDAEDNDGRTPLDLAAEYNSGVIEQFLIEHGANFNVLYVSPFENIFEAAKNGTVQDIVHYINTGVDVNTEDNEGSIPLHYAAGYNSCDVLQCLLEYGGNVDAEDNEGKTPLHCAAGYNSCDVLQCLLDYEADVDAEDNEGRTPLHHAAAYNFKTVLRFLVAHGAGVFTEDHYGNTPLDYATLENKTILRKAMRPQITDDKKSNKKNKIKD